jgi:hypothetical protein
MASPMRGWRFPIAVTSSRSWSATAAAESSPCAFRCDGKRREKLASVFMRAVWLMSSRGSGGWTPMTLAAVRTPSRTEGGIDPESRRCGENPATMSRRGPTPVCEPTTSDDDAPSRTAALRIWMVQSEAGRGRSCGLKPREAWNEPTPSDVNCGCTPCAFCASDVNLNTLSRGVQGEREESFSKPPYSPEVVVHGRGSGKRSRCWKAHKCGLKGGRETMRRPSEELRKRNSLASNLHE